MGGVRSHIYILSRDISSKFVPSLMSAYDCRMVLNTILMMTTAMNVKPWDASTSILLYADVLNIPAPQGGEFWFSGWISSFVPALSIRLSSIRNEDADHRCAFSFL